MAEHAEPVTVFESSDPAAIAVAKSLLEDAGIYFFAAGEALQDVFGAGTIGTGFNTILGPVCIQVAAEDAADAKALLIDLDPDASDAGDRLR